MRADRLRSQQALLRGASAVLAKNPGASLSQICKAAGVSRATLHRHFPGREDLLKALALQALQRIDQATSHIDYWSLTATEGVRLTFEAMMPMGPDFKFLMTEGSAWRDATVKQALDRQYRLMRQLLDALRNEGAVDKAVSVDWLAHSFDALCYAGWAAVADGLPAAEAAALAWRTFTVGLRPQKR